MLERTEGKSLKHSAIVLQLERLRDHLFRIHRVGAAGFVINGWWHGALPSATLNVLWLMIGLFASIRILKRRRSPAL